MPHRDFRKARKVLSGIEADPSAGGAAREFTFGCEGKPRFVIGPDDDDARVTRVIAVLTARFGADGFVVEEFDDPDGVDDEDREAVLEVMDAMFRFVESPHCRDRSLSGFFVQGFVAAALLIEPARECDAWWRELFGGKEPELPDNEEFQPEDIIEGFLELCNDTEDSFTVDDFTPSLPPLDQPDHFSAAADFCRGVLHVIDARPEVGAWLDAGADVSGALATLRRLAALPSEGPTDMTGRRDVARGIGDALRALDAALVERRT